MRKLFPDNAFFDKNIEGLYLLSYAFLGISLKILKEEVSCPGTCKVIFWLRGCFDAIEKRYVCFYIYLLVLVTESNIGSLRKSWWSKCLSYFDILIQFRLLWNPFHSHSDTMAKKEHLWKWWRIHPSIPLLLPDNFSSDKSLSNLPRDQRIKVQTKNLLNAILSAGKMLGPLPKKMMLTMKLQYNNCKLFIILFSILANKSLQISLWLCHEFIIHIIMA